MSQCIASRAATLFRGTITRHIHLKHKRNSDGNAVEIEIDDLIIGGCNLCNNFVLPQD